MVFAATLLGFVKDKTEGMQDMFLIHISFHYSLGLAAIRHDPTFEIQRWQLEAEVDPNLPCAIPQRKRGRGTAESGSSPTTSSLGRSSWRVGWSPSSGWVSSESPVRRGFRPPAMESTLDMMEDRSPLSKYALGGADLQTLPQFECLFSVQARSCW